MQSDIPAVSLALVTQMLKLLDDDAKEAGKVSFTHRMIAAFTPRDGVVELKDFQKTPEALAAREAALQYVLFLQAPK